MPSTKKVQNTHITAQLRELHGAVLDIVSAMNRPQRDEALIKEAGIPLDRALFPLLVSVERFGPIGIVELADRVGRDYTTVSRQVAKLESLGLVERHGNAADRRVREAVVSPRGRAMTERVEAARDRIGRAIFKTWDARDIDDLARLMRKFADAMKTIRRTFHDPGVSARDEAPDCTPLKSASTAASSGRSPIRSHGPLITASRTSAPSR
jgi:DNA-binding MarR family transcriptional regulator